MENPLGGHVSTNRCSIRHAAKSGRLSNIRSVTVPRMKSTSSRLISCALGVVTLIVAPIVAAPAGNAEVVYLPPHEKTFHSEGGPTFVVGHRNETINKVLPLNASGTVREVFLSGEAYSSVDWGGGGDLRVGYHVGCAVELNNASAHGSATSTSGSISVGIGPGQVADVELMKKKIVSDVPGRLIYHDVHLVVNGCIGPAVIRQYAEIQMKSDKVDEVGVVYGDPLWI
ncbi:MspA family porin [Nocardia sp. CA-290969]|uniref:MspA family porin n=1 Tax=Nocardia sp. CA-290969 TaxID=3239986 RepID=UPI003D89EC5E